MEVEQEQSIEIEEEKQNESSGRSDGLPQDLRKQEQITQQAKVSTPPVLPKT